MPKPKPDGTRAPGDVQEPEAVDQCSDRGHGNSDREERVGHIELVVAEVEAVVFFFKRLGLCTGFLGPCLILLDIGLVVRRLAGGDRAIDVAGGFEHSQLRQAVLVDMQLDAGRLIFGPGIHGLLLGLLHGLGDIVILDLRDRHEDRENNDRHRHQIVELLVQAVGFDVRVHLSPRSVVTLV